MSVPVDLQTLARTARDRADQHPGGSVERWAWSCVGVVPCSTPPATATRQAKGKHPLAS